MDNILSRIEQIALKEGLTIAAFERIIGASKGVLYRAISKGTDIQSKWIQTIVENYPQYSPTWLLTGNGPMLIEEKNGYSTNNDRLKVKDTLPIYNKKKEIDNDKVYLDIIKSQEEKIQELNRAIGRLEYEVEMLKQNRLEEPDAMDVGCAAAG